MTTTKNPTASNLEKATYIFTKWHQGVYTLTETEQALAELTLSAADIKEADAAGLAAAILHRDSRKKVTVKDRGAARDRDLAIGFAAAQWNSYGIGRQATEQELQEALTLHTALKVEGWPDHYAEQTVTTAQALLKAAGAAAISEDWNSTDYKKCLQAFQDAFKQAHGDWLHKPFSL